MLAVFTALAEPNRYRIVDLMRSGPRPVNEICERLHLNQPQVSKHLRVLRESGLVAVEVRAQQRVYELRPEPLLELHAWLDRYREIWEERFSQLDGVLDEIKAEEQSRSKTKPRASKR